MTRRVRRRRRLHAQSGCECDAAAAATAERHRRHHLGRRRATSDRCCGGCVRSSSVGEVRRRADGRRNGGADLEPEERTTGGAHRHVHVTVAGNRTTGVCLCTLFTHVSPVRVSCMTAVGSGVCVWGWFGAPIGSGGCCEASQFTAPRRSDRGWSAAARASTERKRGMHDRKNENGKKGNVTPGRGDKVVMFVLTQIRMMQTQDRRTCTDRSWTFAFLKIAPRCIAF